MPPLRCHLLLITLAVFLQAVCSPAVAGEPEKAASQSPLFAAVASGDATQVKRLLEGGADINAVGTSGETALIAAAQQRHQDIVRLLLDRGADVNRSDEDGLTPLIAEAATGNGPLVARLLTLGANANARWHSPFRNNTALQGAAEFGGPEIVRMLLEHGADVDVVNDDGRTPLMASAFLGDAASVRLLLARKAAVNVRDREGNTALSEAAEGPKMDRPRGSNLGIVKSLVSAGADWKAKRPEGETILLRPSAFGHADVVRYFLGLGADVNSRTQDGRTALMVAGTSESVTAVLLSAGAKVNLHSRSDYRTALIQAADGGTPGVVRRLLAAHAEVNAKDKAGRTALMWAINRGELVVASLLIAHGATVHYHDSQGLSPWQLAREIEKTDRVPDSPYARILRLLKKTGADKKPKE